MSRDNLTVNIIACVINIVTQKCFTKTSCPVNRTTIYHPVMYVHASAVINMVI